MTAKKITQNDVVWTYLDGDHRPTHVLTNGTIIRRDHIIPDPGNGVGLIDTFDVLALASGNYLAEGLTDFAEAFAAAAKFVPPQFQRDRRFAQFDLDICTVWLRYTFSTWEEAETLVRQRESELRRVMLEAAQKYLDENLPAGISIR